MSEVCAQPPGGFEMSESQLHLVVDLLEEALDRPDMPEGPILAFGPGAEEVLDMAAAFERETVSWQGTGQPSTEQPLPFEGRSLGAVVMCGVLHTYVDPGEALIECRRALGPSGALVTTTPNDASLQHRLAGFGGAGERPKTAFTPRSLEDIITASGFEPLAVRSEDVVRSRRLARMLPRMGSTLVASALSTATDTDTMRSIVWPQVQRAEPAWQRP
jgi:SAM-dependent methyltransferase